MKITSVIRFVYLSFVMAVLINQPCATNNMPNISDTIIYSNDLVNLSEQLTFSDERKSSELAIEKARSVKDTLQLAAAYFRLASNQQLQGQNSVAFSNMNIALGFYAVVNNQLGIAHCLDNIGSIYRYRGAYEKALEYHYKAKDVFIEQRDTTGLIHSINNLGILYRNLNDYPRARELYFKAIELGDKTNSNLLATVYNSVGSFFWYQQKNDSALLYYRKALGYKPVTLQLKERHCAVLNNIGNVYRTSGRLDSALHYYELSLIESYEYELDNLAAITLKNQAKTYLLKGWLNKANTSLSKSIELAKRSSLVKILMENYLVQSEIYLRKGDYEKSLEKHVLYSQMKDSVLSVDQLNRIAQLELDYTLQQVEKDKLILKKNIAERDLEIASNRNYLFSFIFFTVLLILIAGVIYLRYLSNVKLKRKLQLLNEELEKGVRQRTKSLEDEIEEHKRTEEELLKSKLKAEEADRLKTAFLSNMSHEIRTPMNAIIGFSDLLLDADFNQEEKAEFANLIQSNGDDLLHLLNDIIDISMIESGQLKLVKSRILVCDLIEQVQNSYLASSDYLTKDSLEFILEVPSNNITILSDEFRLRQILNNLVSNALKFTHKGHVKLGFRVEAKFILFYVEDTGVGIDKLYQKQIFERFLKVENDVSNLNRGNGLGLTITKNLVHLLDGSIELYSEEGVGSRFTVQLPL